MSREDTLDLLEQEFKQAPGGVGSGGLQLNAIFASVAHSTGASFKSVKEIYYRYRHERPILGAKDNFHQLLTNEEEEARVFHTFLSLISYFALRFSSESHKHLICTVLRWKISTY